MTAGSSITLDQATVSAATISAVTTGLPGDITLSNVNVPLGGTNLAFVFAAGGAINITSSAGTLTLTTIENGGNLDANDININSTGQQITAGIVAAHGLGDVQLTGSTLVDDGLQTTRISGDDLQLNFTGNIGGAGGVGPAIDTNVNTINIPFSGDLADNVWLNELNDVTLTAIWSAGLVNIAAGGVVNVDLVNAGTTVNISGTSVLEFGADPAADILGTAISLIATNGSIGLAGNAIEIDSTTSVSADSSAAGGLINLAETVGNMNVGSINADTGNVTLTASGAGQQVLGGVPNGIAEVTGGLLYVRAGSNVDLETHVNSLDIQTTDAGAYVSITDVYPQATSLAIVNITTNNGVVEVYNTLSSANILIGSINTNSGGGVGGGAAITLTAGGEMTDLGEDAVVDLVGTTGNLFAFRGGIGAGNAIETNLTSLSFIAAGEVKINEVAAGGALHVSGLATGSDITITTAAGTLTVDAGGLDATAGDITLTAGGAGSNVVVGGALLTTQGRINITADTNITQTAAVGPINADNGGVGLKGDVNLTATNGAITGNGNLITGRALDAEAHGNINTNTNVDYIIANSATGSVTINETDDVEVGHISAPAAGQTVNITAGGDVVAAIDKNTDVLANASITVNARGPVTLETESPALEVNTGTNPGDILILSRYGALVTFKGITAISGRIMVDAANAMTINGPVTAGAGGAGNLGNIDLRTESGSLTVSSAVTANSGLGTVALHAANALVQNAQVHAGDGITLGADAAGAGAIQIGASVNTDNGWIDIEASSATGDIAQSAGTITKNGPDGTVLVIGHTVNLSGLGIVSATSSGIAIKIGASGNVITGGTAVLTANTGGTESNIIIDTPFEVTIGADVTANGDVSIMALHSINLNANVTADANSNDSGSVYLTADSDTVGGGDLIVLPVTKVVTGENVTVLAANVNGGIFRADRALDGTDGDLVISTTGVAGGAGAASIVEAKGVNVIINAGGDVNVNTATATQDVAITGGSVNVGSILATNDDVTVDANGTFTSGPVTAGDNVTITADGTVTTNGIVQGANVALTSTTANLAINNTVTGNSGGVGEVVLTAKTDIIANASGTIFGANAVTITADRHVTLSAPATANAGVLTITSDANDDGIGDVYVTAPLNGNDVVISGQAVTVAAVTADAGNVTISADGVLTTTGLVQATEDVTASAASMAINAWMTADSNSNGSGKLTLAADGAVNAAGQTLSGVDVTIDGGSITVASLVATSGDVTVNSSGTFTNSGAVTAWDDVTISADLTVTTNGTVQGATVALTSTGADLAINNTVTGKIGRAHV